MLLSVHSVLLLGTIASAQFPKKPDGLTLLRSRFNDSVTISYKETHICETTPGVRSFAGYVSLPPNTTTELGINQSFPINTFFWYFEARNDPQNAPLSLWFSGGPGSSSFTAILSENGPCWVNADSKTTRLNEWSWNTDVNMLYIDQPVQPGLSFDGLHNITYDLLYDETTLLNDTSPIPAQNATFVVGTGPSGNENKTAIGSVAAAVHVWHFLQVWTREFPEYKTSDSRISLAAESYGGKHGPEFFYFVQKQNEKIAATTCSTICPLQILNLDTLLIVNGCVGDVQLPSFPQFAYNNTYGIQAVNKTTYDNMTFSYTRKDGCKDQVEQCQMLSIQYDPDLVGINDTVNDICHDAYIFCEQYVKAPYHDSGRNWYDVTALDPVSMTPPFFRGYMQNPFVQEALGAPMN